MYQVLPSWIPWYGATARSAAGTVTIMAWSSARAKWPTEENWVASPPGVGRGSGIVFTGRLGENHSGDARNGRSRDSRILPATREGLARVAASTGGGADPARSAR